MRVRELKSLIITMQIQLRKVAKVNKMFQELVVNCLETTMKN